MIEKTGIKAKLLTLESTQLESSRQNYMRFLQSATVDGSEPSDKDQISQAQANAEIAVAFDTSFHSYAQAMRIVEGTDFGNKSIVVVGAAIQLSGRWFVVAIATEPFDYEGTSFMGISPESAIFKAAAGMSAGETFTVNGRTWLIDAVA